MEQKTITITVEEYKKLVEDSYHLSLLQARGVDNWSGYCSLPSRKDFDTDKEWEAAIEKAATYF